MLLTIRAYLLIAFLLFAFRLSGQDKAHIDSVLAKISNENIEYGTYRPTGAKTVLLERSILITGPAAALELFNLGKAATPYLLTSFDDEKRDWELYVIACAIYQEDPMLVIYYSESITRWRREIKKHDRAYFEKFVK